MEAPSILECSIRMFAAWFGPFRGCYEIRFGKSSIHWRKRRFTLFSFRSRCSVQTNIQPKPTSMLSRVSSILLLPLRSSFFRRSHHALFFSSFVQQRQALAANFVTPSFRAHEILAHDEPGPAARAITSRAFSPWKRTPRHPNDFRT